MKKTIGILISFLILVLAVCLHPGLAMAERYYEEPEYEEGYYDAGYYEASVPNHLREDSWVRNGSFISYVEDGFLSMVGVDVSKWNGDIDWYLLREQGVEFAIIRVGYRGYETGDIVLDEKFYEYMDGATAAGMRIGVYFYSQAIDEEEAIEEAMFVINHIAGYYITLPVYFDTEDVRLGESRTDVMATANYTLNALAFCQAVEAQGYRAGIYASQDWIRRNLELNRLADYEIWYASYGLTPGKEYGFDMWQYSDLGDLYGCDTYLDMNVRVERLY